MDVEVAKKLIEDLDAAATPDSSMLASPSHPDGFLSDSTSPSVFSDEDDNCSFRMSSSCDQVGGWAPWNRNKMTSTIAAIKTASGTSRENSIRAAKGLQRRPVRDVTVLQAAAVEAGDHRPAAKRACSATSIGKLKDCAVQTVSEVGINATDFSAPTGDFSKETMELVLVPRGLEVVTESPDTDNSVSSDVRSLRHQKKLHALSKGQLASTPRMWTVHRRGCRRLDRCTQCWPVSFPLPGHTTSSATTVSATSDEDADRSSWKETKRILQAECSGVAKSRAPWRLGDAAMALWMAVVLASILPGDRGGGGLLAMMAQMVALGSSRLPAFCRW